MRGVGRIISVFLGRMRRCFGMRFVCWRLEMCCRVLWRRRGIVSSAPILIFISTFTWNWNSDNCVAFNDEICGVSYSLRWNAVQIAIWNRDAENEEGIAKLLETVLEKLSEEVRPKRKEEYWYKAHKAHKGFAGPV